MTTEVQAYLDGNIELADALARIAELEAEVEALENVVTLESWEKSYGPASEYYEFFHDCFARLNGHYPYPSVTYWFARLNGHYPCPDITSDYDKSIIFNAIERGEGVTE